MRKPIITMAAFLLCAASLSAAQADAKSLLRDAAARYRAAKSFHLEWETTIQTSSPYMKGWSKQIYAVAATDHKFHHEVKGSNLRSVRINDGQSDWFYRPGAHEYSVQSADPTKPRSLASGTAAGSTEGWIKSAMQSLLSLDEDADASELQREEVLTVGTAKSPCYVVRTERSISFREGVNTTRENTYWIDKNSGLVRKAILSTSGPGSPRDDNDEIQRTVETIYTRMDLNTTPDPALFEFKPPANAYLMDDARQPMSPSLRAGITAPALRLKDKSGVMFDLADLKGKVALVQFWATWCGACHEEMKALAQLLPSYTAKGLVVVSVDEDEIPERGDTYFSSQKYGWMNLHDAGEVCRRTWGASGIPLLVLVDRDGKIVWANSGIGTNFSAILQSQLSKPELALIP